MVRDFKVPVSRYFILYWKKRSNVSLRSVVFFRKIHKMANNKPIEMFSMIDHITDKEQFAGYCIVLLLIS